jgi:hypothetical protein
MQDESGAAADNQLCRGVAKLVKAPDFDSGIRRFESFLLCHKDIAEIDKPPTQDDSQALAAFQPFNPRALGVPWRLKT